MELWSKGLGKRVLSLSLAEHESVTARDGLLSVDGVMKAPTYWDYAVTLDEEDLVEFLGLLQQREALRFLSADGRSRAFMRAAIPSVVVFAARTVSLLVRGVFTRDRATDPESTTTREDAEHVRT